MLSKNDIPQFWSSLTWQQLCDAWQCKLRYGGNADVARAAALLALLGLEPSRENREEHDPVTGERRYMLVPDGGSKFFTLHSIPEQSSPTRSLSLFTLTPRELSQMVKQTMKWFDFPYGDPGKEAVKDEKGKVVEEAVAPVTGYVNPDWRDAMQLPEETLVVCGDRILTGSEWQGLADAERDKILHSSLFTHHFKLPSVALYNITWQQYRTLQSLAPLLFQEGASDDDILSLQAEFLAHILVPAREVAADGRTVGHPTVHDPFAPKREFEYDSDRAEQTVAFWKEKTLPQPLPAREGSGYICRLSRRLHPSPQQRYIPPSIQGGAGGESVGSVLFSICFQTYQTAMRYYEVVFPLLFNGGGKSDTLQDALTGETKTINAVMKYQGYTKPEDVYAENLPVILSTLNTMAEEAKQIEQMNARIKH